jgi:hypothetical protein
MEYKGKERRGHPRTYVEPYDTGTYLEFRQGSKSYRFNLLDTSPEGMGMLVRMETAEVLNNMGIGDHIRMEYKTAEASMVMDFEVRHISRIVRGRYKGHHQVGLSLISGPK